MAKQAELPIYKETILPFDLEIMAVPGKGGVGWTMKAPWWLNNTVTPPLDPACIRELTDESWMRDRYAPMSAGELMAWHEDAWGKRIIEAADDETRGMYEDFTGYVGKMHARVIFLLHWEEWETGLN